MGSSKVITIIVFLVAFSAFVAVWRPRRIQLPQHLLGHTIVPLPGLLSPEVAEQLMTLSKEMRVFPTNLADLKFYATKHEHIGEAQPIGADGSCAHPYLVPSNDKRSCILPGRVDVGRHFLIGGGVEGLKEPFDHAASRLLSFGRYIFNVSEHAIVERLFAAEHFQRAARSVCPTHQQHLDPFQFNLIVQVPGQTVAEHLDAPYFWGATRFQLPQWLLVTMVFSGLFTDRFVHQVQVVGYYHRWSDVARRSGDFVYWDRNDAVPSRMPAEPLAGNVVDGSKTVHAASIYFPDRKAPALDKSADSELRYDSARDRWELVSNGATIATYATDDLRMTIVYRARCFANQSEAERFRNLPDEQYLTLDYILDTLHADLVRRGRLDHSMPRPDALSFALLLLEEYVKYPFAAAQASVIPYNYCALSKIAPWTEYILRYLC